jgi:hypothetical protein
MTLRATLRLFLAAQHDATLDRHHFPGQHAGLAAYRNNVRFNRTDALTEAFPTVHALVGNDYFDGLARAYVQTTPARHADLHREGETFPDFIADFEPARDLPYLPDVARLDWARHRAYFADDIHPTDLSALATLSPAAHGSLRLVTAPGLACVASPWPIWSIWGAHHDQCTFPRLDQGGETALVWRDRAMVVQTTAIEPDMASVLLASRDGQPLAALDALGDSTTQGLAQRLITWWQSGVVWGLALPATPSHPA